MGVLIEVSLDTELDLTYVDVRVGASILSC